MRTLYSLLLHERSVAHTDGPPTTTNLEMSLASRPPMSCASWFREEAAKPEDLSDLEGAAGVRRELVRLRRLFRAVATELPTGIEAALAAERWGLKTVV